MSGVNGIVGSVRAIQKAFESIEITNIREGIKECILNLKNIEQSEQAIEEEKQQVGGQTVTMQDDYSLVDSIRGDMGDGR